MKGLKAKTTHLWKIGYFERMQFTRILSIPLLNILVLLTVISPGAHILKKPSITWRERLCVLKDFSPYLLMLVLDYCNSVWSSASQSVMQSFINVQNRFRFISLLKRTQLDNFKVATPLLSIPERRLFHIAIQTDKSWIILVLCICANG